MKWTQAVNVDVQQNILAGIKAGLLIPGIKYRNKLTEQEDYELYHSRDWVASGPVFIENVEGPRITLNGLWTGDRIIFSTMVMNFRGLLNNDQGVLLDSNVVTIFEDRARLGVKILKKLAEYVNEHEAYVGWLSVDVVISENNIYYNLVRVGIPVDFCVGLEQLYGVPYEHFGTHQEVPAQDNFASVLKLYTYPYSMGKDADGLVTGLPAIWTGTSWVVTDRSNKVNRAWSNLYAQIPDHYSRFGLCYRTDGLTVSKKCFEELQKAGVL